MTGAVRIIGGQWRGQRLTVQTAHDLRPTPSRARETLFNWLRTRIDGAWCLDLFSGSGALGFEALSRGADFVVMVEQAPALAKQLVRQAEVFRATNQVQVACEDALVWLRQARVHRPFDLVFLDPPFALPTSAAACARSLLRKSLLKKDGLLYVEGPRTMPPLAGFETINQSRAGQVHFKLMQPVSVQQERLNEKSHLSRHL